MTSRNGWQRVRRDRPCPICGRPDWCLLSVDGSAAICARVETSKKCGDAGWLHRIRDDFCRPGHHFVRSIPLETSPAFDFAALAGRFQEAVEPGALDHLARNLGLSAASLRALAIGWNGWAWSFPMVNSVGNVLGIRLRRPNGRKLAVAGGKEGLFVPVNTRVDSQLLICEGPTDVAALLDLGFSNVVGRPSCRGGRKLLMDLVREKQHSDVVIVADGDETGRRGADNLASLLVAFAKAVRVIQPPLGIKDARAWLVARGTQQDIQTAIDAALARRLSVRAIAKAKV